MTDKLDLTQCSRKELALRLRHLSVQEWCSAVSAAKTKDPDWIADLQEADLSSADLSKKDLAGANLQSADLENVNLREADLRNAELKSAKLNNANLNKAIARNAVFNGAQLENTQFRKADLSGAQFRKAFLYRTDFLLATLWKTSFHEAQIAESLLTEANLRESDFEDALFSGSNLQGADLRRTNMKGMKILKTDLKKADLTKADLSSTYISGTDLGGAILEEANLSGVSMENVNLSDAKLIEANIHGVDFGNSCVWDAFVKLAYCKTEGRETNTTLSGGCYPVGFLENETVLLFPIQEEPWYTIKCGPWSGFTVQELVGCIDKNDELFATEELERQAKLVETVIESTVRDLLRVDLYESERPDISTSTPASYLNAESRRTGKSPADIALGDG